MKRVRRRSPPKRRPRPAVSPFAAEAEGLLALPIAHRVNRLGGYGPAGEVIFEHHPTSCPTQLVDHQGDATATFMSNGSIGLVVKPPNDLEVNVLDLSFDPVEKREIGVPSSNVWLDVTAGRKRHVASLMNPRSHLNAPAAAVKIVKLGEPRRAMWFAARFTPAPGLAYVTAVRLALVLTSAGPALLRQVFVKNTGRKPLAAKLWTHFTLHGTQRFVYNKETWYDAGLPLSNTETVVAATVPYSESVQLKRVSSAPQGMRAADATCDYSTFVGDSAAFLLMPEAVRRGAMLPGGAGKRLNRFSTATVAANLFTLALRPGQSATLGQSLLYVSDPALVARFRALSAYADPSYQAMAAAFKAAARDLVKATPGAPDCSARREAPPAGPPTAPAWPPFELALPHEPIAALYLNSVWTGVQELYEKCRAHGARLAQGIELGTRDRAQDMWPKLKEDPGRVRADLLHALSFMYVTADAPPTNVGTLTLPQKLYGQFPRQYPSRWDDRSVPVPNDNRPYADSACWFLDALFMYIRETGDFGILSETVGTVRLTDPEHPVTSAMVGADRRQTVLETVLEVLESYGRLIDDSPYGMVQALYGDWCDPLDMYGTDVVGDASRRGWGRGVQVRLSAQVFLTLVEAIDLLQSFPAADLVHELRMMPRVEAFKALAGRLRENIVRLAWEEGDSPGFVDFIHELRKDGSRPDYARGELGYTAGSMRGLDPDGIPRRVLVTQAWGLAMLTTTRDYLTPVHRTNELIQAILKTTDSLFSRPKLGLVLFTRPIANSPEAVKYFGRMGVVPSGCAENGEYHHGQVMMHRFRLDLPGQADTVWRQFSPIMSARRDERLNGPFDMPTNCYASDRDDPHFGTGMYFGLSGSVDWIVEIIHKIVGLKLALHDVGTPDVTVTPNLPAAWGETLTFKRVIHAWQPAGGYKQIPFRLDIRRAGTAPQATETVVLLNGQRIPEPVIQDVKSLDRVHLEITRLHGVRKGPRPLFFGEKPLWRGQKR